MSEREVLYRVLMERAMQSLREQHVSFEVRQVAAGVEAALDWAIEFKHQSVEAARNAVASALSSTDTCACLRHERTGVCQAKRCNCDCHTPTDTETAEASVSTYWHDHAADPPQSLTGGEPDGGKYGDGCFCSSGDVLDEMIKSRGAGFGREVAEELEKRRAARVCDFNPKYATLGQWARGRCDICGSPLAAHKTPEEWEKEF